MLSDRYFADQFLAEVSGVNHGCVPVDRIGNFFWRFHQNQFGTRQSDGVVKCASPSDHDDFVFQPSGIGELPDFLGITACHARGG